MIQSIIDLKSHIFPLPFLEWRTVSANYPQITESNIATNDYALRSILPVTRVSGLQPLL